MQRDSNNLDVLRSLAVLSVLISHMDYRGAFPSRAFYHNVGVGGVLIFFVHTSLVLGGRPGVNDRKVFAGIVYRLRTGCQWDAIPSEIGSGSTSYRRSAEWAEQGVFEKLHAEMLHYYHVERGIDWEWASLDGAIVKTPKGGTSRARVPPIAENAAPNVMF